MAVSVDVVIEVEEGGDVVGLEEVEDGEAEVEFRDWHTMLRAGHAEAPTVDSTADPVCLAQLYSRAPTEEHCYA